MSMVERAIQVMRILLSVLPLGAALPAQAGETVTFFHNDVAGSPMVATDVNGFQVWKETYRPYGDRLIDSSASQNNDLWFTGKPFDESTGLSYMGERYYDPTLGRFTGVDPVRTKPFDLHGFNRYSYANNNPYKYVDPDGREVRQQTHWVGTFQHTKITIIPDNQKKWANHPNFKNQTLPKPDGRVYATLGAGQPTNNWSYGLLGYPLIGAPNRVTDLDLSANSTDQLLTLPEGMSEDDLIARLFALDAAYGDDLDYSVFPSSWADGYNSNSYAIGLLHAAGFRSLKVPPGTSGYDKPLEPSYFKRPTVTIRECGERC